MTQPEDKDKALPGVQGLRATKKAAAAAKKTAANNVREIGSGKKAAPKPGPAKKAAAKAPAKKAEPRAKAEPKPKVLRDPEHPWYTHPGYVVKKDGQQLYEATGMSGQISVRASDKPLTYAISWGDPDRPGERAQHIRIGVISDFFESEEAAIKVAKKRREDYPTHKIEVVKVRPYRGQPGDKK
jgi:hypothetical protein